MKKAAKILLMAAGILGVLSFITAVVFAIIFFVAPSVPELQQAIADGLQQAMDEGMKEEYYEMLEWAANNLSVFTSAMGGCLLGSAFITLVSVIFSFIGLSADKKGLYLVNAILGFFAGSLLQLIGGILGILGSGNKAQEPVKEVEAKEESTPVEEEKKEEPKSEPEEKAEPVKEEKKPAKKAESK